MKKNLRYWAVAAVGAVVALGFTSCAYDPYYQSSAGASYSTSGGGGSYSSGYGDGYGYGGSSFSTSLFVGTGNPQWGYDPGCHSYYDYRRRSYYDPYLNGYYPVGYRPPVVYGTPHPYGWSSGRDYISPPRYVSGGYVSNYRDRESRYRNSNYGWARQVRRSSNEEEDRGQRQLRDRYERSGRSGYQDSGIRPYGESRPSPRFEQSQRQLSRGGMQRAPQQIFEQRTRQEPQGDRRQERTPRSASREMEQNFERQASRYNSPVSAGRDESRSQRSQPRAERGGERTQSSSKPSRGGARREEEQR
jgi:hypothetical protein